ncbi:DUF4354 family protein [Enterobacter cloacae]|uniref:DUF4354 family protein n=1 Tax=Enterobacter cloacae TaxID=550 RepID=UPI002A82BCA2|nr:DUF4354 family protein [Enterobacter cloacae]
MMKLYAFLFINMLSMVSLPIQANNLDSVAIHASEKSRWAITVGDKHLFIKSFELIVTQLSKDSIDLSEHCFKAYTTDQNEYDLDSVDEVLSTGVLIFGKSIRGVVSFSSDEEHIHKASLVRITKNC